jgi:hypothetical protein
MAAVGKKYNRYETAGPDMTRQSAAAADGFVVHMGRQNHDFFGARLPDQARTIEDLRGA